MLRAHRHCSVLEREKLEGKAISPSFFWPAPLFLLFHRLCSRMETYECALESALIGLSGSSKLTFVCFSLVPGLRLPSEAGHQQPGQQYKAALSSVRPRTFSITRSSANPCHPPTPKTFTRVTTPARKINSSTVHLTSLARTARNTAKDEILTAGVMFIRAP